MFGPIHYSVTCPAKCSLYVKFCVGILGQSNWNNDRQFSSLSDKECTARDQVWHGRRPIRAVDSTKELHGGGAQGWAWPLTKSSRHTWSVVINSCLQSTSSHNTPQFNNQHVQSLTVQYLALNTSTVLHHIHTKHQPHWTKNTNLYNSIGCSSDEPFISWLDINTPYPALMSTDHLQYEMYKSYILSRQLTRSNWNHLSTIDKPQQIQQ